MAPFHIALLLAVLLCTLVGGFVFAFAVVAMPGIATLEDRAFLRAFQVMDRVIQNNQPLFILVWAGSAVAIVASMLLGFQQVQGVDRALLILAGVFYLLGVQLPTATVNVPLNNHLQTLDLHTLDDTALATARGDFEARWNRWNELRTLVSILVSVLLIVLMLRL